MLIATERELPEPDPDEEVLLRALAGAGLMPRLAAWDDPVVDWGAGRITIIRSTWNYFRARDAFVEWVVRASLASQLWNPAGVVRWNSHKSYLVELAERGVPAVPTVVAPRGAGWTLASLMASRGWRQVVVKPAVSASSYRTQMADGSDPAAEEEHFRSLVEAGDALVQPYLESVEGYGERAVVWIDGQFTHAVRKAPRFAEGEERVSEAVEIAPDEMEAAERALAQVREPLLYARVDLARDEWGRPLVMELELIEPSLFLVQYPPALERLVAGIRRRVGGLPA